jgi:hypothetical protein
MSKLFKKKFLIICLSIFIIAGSIFTYSFIQKEKQKQGVNALLNELTEAVNLMDSVRDKMPGKLLAVHQFSVEQIQKDKIKFYQIPSELKNFIMVHGAKSEVLYANPLVRLKPEIWIPLFYHEVGHLYWHQEHPFATFEEFQEQLFESEIHSYTVDAQAWNIVGQYFPVEKNILSEIEQALFDLYNKETSLYNKMIEGDLESKEKWIGIIEKDIESQKLYQELFKK